MLDLDKLNKDTRVKLYSELSEEIITKESLDFINKKLVRESKQLQNKSIEEIADYFKIKVISTDYNCGGYFDTKENTIAFKKHHSEHTKRHVFYHEFGHYIQCETGVYFNQELLLSNLYHNEQEAEAIANKVYDIFFPLCEKDEDFFDGYFDLDALKFLKNWYKGSKVQNDLIK